MEYASNGKGNLGVTLGAIGTGLSVLNGGMGLLGTNVTGNNNYVTKDEMRMMQDLAAKDSEIALLKADQESEIKMTEVYKQSHTELADLRDRMDTKFENLRLRVDTMEREQAVANTKISDSIAVLGDKMVSVNSILAQITQTKIPNSAVCPGWGGVSVIPNFNQFNYPGTTFA